MQNLEPLIETIRAELETRHRAREAAIEASRVLVRHCANAIRAMHRQEWQSAEEQLVTAQGIMLNISDRVRGFPDLYFAGYTQDAFKEYAEARLLLAMLRGADLPTPTALNLENATYLNGLCEAASELRRYVLDVLRQEHSEQAERLLDAMESVYDLLITVDFPDVITGGLRHRTDSLRAVLERTRGDVTTSLRQQRLERALAASAGSSPAKHKPPLSL
jgi:translin